MKRLLRCILIAAGFTSWIAACGARAKDEVSPSDNGDGTTAGTGQMPTKRDGGIRGPAPSPTSDVPPESPVGPTSPPPNGPGPSGTQLRLWSNELHTGFDGKHPYYDVLISTALLKYDDNGEPKDYVPFTDPPIMTIENTDIATVKIVAIPKAPFVQEDKFLKVSTFARISPKRPGVTELKVKAGAATETAHIEVREYTPAQFELGKQRYTAPVFPGAARKPCAVCHDAKSPGQTVVSHDSFVLSRYSDEEIIGIVKTGRDIPNDPTVTLNVPGGHVWHLTPEEEQALPAYIRALHPLGL
jgi:hypothetical protein